MSYNRNGYFIRAARIQELTRQYYEPERQDRCYKWVWRKHIRPIYGIGYRAYLRYLWVVDPYGKIKNKEHS